VRLNGLDMAFLCMEQSDRPMHMGALLTFESPGSVPPERIASLLAARAGAAPQLVQYPRSTIWPPAGAAWTPDPSFDADRHVEVHRLPSPAPELRAKLVASLMATPLPTGRPPWELHVITAGEGQFTVLAKVHHAMVDGAGVLPIAGALLDDVGDRARRVRRPQPKPTDAKPSLTGLLAAARDELGNAAQRVGQLAGVASAAAGAVRPPSATAPLTSLLDGSGDRAFTSVHLDANDLHKARKQLGGTFNDVLLSVIAGGLRSWLTDHAEAPAEGTTLRALIPVSLRARRNRQTVAGNHLSGYLVDLPIGEPDPLVRVDLLRTTMARHKAAGSASGAGAFPLLAESLPPLAHRLAAPLLGQFAPLLFDALVTTVPLPDIPLRLHGAALESVTPIGPLAPGHGLSIATTVYRRTAHIGLLSDPQLLPGAARIGDDINHAAAALYQACEELPG
jgi:diacylglycerol O-acyltransferase